VDLSGLHVISYKYSEYKYITIYVHLLGPNHLYFLKAFVVIIMYIFCSTFCELCVPNHTEKVPVQGYSSHTVCQEISTWKSNVYHQ
jgi:hypothetical protein